MVALHLQLTVVLCLFLVPHLSLAYPRKSLFKRTSLKKDPRFQKTSMFKSKPTQTVGMLGGSVVLECQVSGIPPALVYWVKDGERIHQGDTHTGNREHHMTSDGLSRLELSSTQSRLYLDCLSEEDAGIYVCVGHSPAVTIKQEHRLTIDTANGIEQTACAWSGQPRIFMWTSSRLEYETGTVQLFCRAQGSPTPTITWYDRDNMPIDPESDSYTVTPTGDLIIRDIDWSLHMGEFTCEAKNDYGSDSASAFLYPTGRGK
ncbi:zwei Ig domain protein zig-2-like isoform X2 [Physella acuta]|uniref:zwei Ig domain protein zig-2-like isoform X2 n=1 Tax=Physella acuta TaxID=109671 RepID=UPI0027DE4284|nr:zwei Ig domain protein zig-2-like isoform X2 [Physella acuta]